MRRAYGGTQSAVHIRPAKGLLDRILLEDDSPLTNAAFPAVTLGPKPLRTTGSVNTGIPNKSAGFLLTHNRRNAAASRFSNRFQPARCPPRQVPCRWGSLDSISLWRSGSNQLCHHTHQGVWRLDRGAEHDAGFCRPEQYGNASVGCLGVRCLQRPKR